MSSFGILQGFIISYLVAVFHPAPVLRGRGRGHGMGGVGGCRERGLCVLYIRCHLASSFAAQEFRRVEVSHSGAVQMSGYNEDVRQRLSALLSETCSQGSVSRWGAASKLLLDAKAAYRKVLLPSELLVHAANRSGLMLNGAQVHATGSMVFRIGCSTSELHHATCFEVPSGGLAKERLLKASKDCVARAEGMLCEVSGAERARAPRSRAYGRLLIAAASRAYGPAGL